MNEWMNKDGVDAVFVTLLLTAHNNDDYYKEKRRENS